MTKNQKGLLAVLVVAALGAGVYLYTKKSKGAKANDYSTKEGCIKILQDGKFSIGSTDVLMRLDYPFLKQWATDASAGASVFAYNGKNYHTKGGTAI